MCSRSGLHNWRSCRAAQRGRGAAGRGLAEDGVPGLNDEPYVSADVRRRVLAAAEELGYRRNNAARALASGRTRSIGVVTLGTGLYGPASLLMGVERAVRDTGYALRVVNTMEGDPAGIAGAVARSSTRAWTASSSPSRSTRRAGGAVRAVDVPVLVLGAPPPFAAPTVVTAGSAPA
jgi:DNA-binding LacI/PurR family transcriptional regulator